MWEYLFTLIIENYGPIGLFAASLAYKQRKLTDVVITLAEEQPGVNEENVRNSVRPFND